MKRMIVDMMTFVQVMMMFFVEIQLFGIQWIETIQLVNLNAPVGIQGNAYHSRMYVIMTHDGTFTET